MNCINGLWYLVTSFLYPSDHSATHLNFNLCNEEFMLFSPTVITSLCNCWQSSCWHWSWTCFPSTLNSCMSFSCAHNLQPYILICFLLILTEMSPFLLAQLSEHSLWPGMFSNFIYATWHYGMLTAQLYHAVHLCESRCVYYFSPLNYWYFS